VKLILPQISMKHEAHLKKYPDAKVISLGIGDTTEPIPRVITSAMAEVFFVLYLKLELFFSLFL
jgi:LL-diaminopimelate aminotransferase